MLVVCAAALAAGAAAAEPACEPARSLYCRAIESRNIRVDQFGYRLGDEKVAVLVDPRAGFNAAESYTPGARIQLRDRLTDEVVFEAGPTLWNGGTVQESSGDRGWWFTFTSVSREGTYYLFDAERQVRSVPFRIADDVYDHVLRAALRMFFYNRSGYAKKPPHADPRWADDAAFVGPGQDTEARAITDMSNAALRRDVSGGWFDAGDTNKYVTFASQAVHQLLAAYRERPKVWTDAVGLPESGNGTPDILDEVKWELDWLKRMQRADGGVHIKVGTLDFADVSPPSLDRRPRYYGPVCSSSTIAAAGMFAHAAVVFAGVRGLSDEALDLWNQARAAWRWYANNPKDENCDNQDIKSGDADRTLGQQDAERVVAGIYLYALSGDMALREAVDTQYKTLEPYRDVGWSRYQAIEGDALLFYTTLHGIDPQVKKEILAKKRTEAATYGEIYGTPVERDLYRAYMEENSYHWGSNGVRAQLGNVALDVMTYKADEDVDGKLKNRALNIVHYLNGVNPFGMVYLSNMYEAGASRSVNEIYHQWFAANTRFSNAKTSSVGPAPGYLAGGPNKSYSGDLAPPKGEPVQKAYRDTNAGWPAKSWELSEPGIYYQAAFIKLLSKFVSSP